jgi:hypothetical protein
LRRLPVSQRTRRMSVSLRSTKVLPEHVHRLRKWFFALPGDDRSIRAAMYCRRADVVTVVGP